MRINEYIPLAVRTDSTRHADLQRRLRHACIGLSTESAELLHHVNAQNLIEELGDLCWYCAITFDACGKAPDHPDQTQYYRRGGSILGIERTINAIIRESGDALDSMKKVEFYGRVLNEGMKHSIWTNCERVIGLVDRAARIVTGVANTVTLAHVLDLNIAKLKVRYPEQFTQESALRRDLAAEAKVFT